MPAGFFDSFELLTVARFPICWSVIRFMWNISGNMKESLCGLPLVLPLLRWRSRHCVACCSRIHSKRSYEAYAAAIFFSLLVLS